MDLLSRLHGLECASGDRSACTGRCDEGAGEYFGAKFSRCPVAEIADDDALTAARMLRSQAAQSPLAGWPDAYTHGVVAIMTELAVAESERRASDSPGGEHG